MSAVGSISTIGEVRNLPPLNPQNLLWNQRGEAWSRAIYYFFMSARRESAIPNSDRVCARPVPEFPTRDRALRLYLHTSGSGWRLRAAMNTRRAWGVSGFIFAGNGSIFYPAQGI